MSRPAHITLGRLHLPASSRVGAEGFARDVAHHLRDRLATAGVTGAQSSIHVTVSPGEAGNPSAIADAVLRALKSGTSR